MNPIMSCLQVPRGELRTRDVPSRGTGPHIPREAVWKNLKQRHRAVRVVFRTQVIVNVPRNRVVPPGDRQVRRQQ